MNQEKTYTIEQAKEHLQSVVMEESKKLEEHLEEKRSNQEVIESL